MDACQDADALRSYLAGAESWLSRLRRNQPNQAREADKLVDAAWERIRAAARPDWAIIGSNGATAEFRDAKEWLAEWRRRVDTIEAAPRSIQARRAALERLLTANGPVLRRMERRGRVVLALDATAAAAKADGRLAAEEQDITIMPVAAE